MATWTAVPLLTVSLVTTAVRLPAVVGLTEIVTVSAVAVAAVTVPTAPSLKVTELLAAVESKPKPLIVSEVALAARLAVLLVTTGATVATWTAAPLLTTPVVTTAVRLPAVVGLVENVTVSEVGVAVVTVPTAPSLKTTVLLPAVASKPKPLMVSVVALAARLVVLLVTTGATVATGTAEPLLTVSVVTTAVKLPAVVGFVENVTVSAVAVAPVMVPTAPLLKLTVLLLAVVASKPKPLMIRVVALAVRLAVLLVTTGATVATWTAVPLLTPLVVTTAVRLPTAVGSTVSATVSEVADAAVTVPTAPSLKTTVLLPAVELKPKPLMVSVVALTARLAVLLVTAGATVATWTAAPLLTPSVVTTAVRLPAAVGFVENVTVSEVAVAAVTVPAAPSLKTTVLLPGVVSKPKPLMVSVVALAARLVVLLVTTGAIVATWITAPLLTPSVVTTAVRLSAVVGFVENVTVSEVGVAVVTAPTAPSLKTTVLLLAVVASKPVPLIVTVVALSARRKAVFASSIGETCATCTGAPLLTLLLVTTAVRLPAVTGFVENVTVSEVAVAAVTVPTAPSLKATVL